MYLLGSENSVHSLFLKKHSMQKCSCLHLILHYVGFNDCYLIKDLSHYFYSLVQKWLSDNLLKSLNYYKNQECHADQRVIHFLQLFQDCVVQINYAKRETILVFFGSYCKILQAFQYLLTILNNFSLKCIEESNETIIILFNKNEQKRIVCKLSYFENLDDLLLDNNITSYHNGNNGFCSQNHQLFFQKQRFQLEWLDCLESFGIGSFLCSNWFALDVPNSRLLPSFFEIPSWNNTRYILRSNFFLRNYKKNSQFKVIKNKLYINDVQLQFQINRVILSMQKQILYIIKNTLGYNIVNEHELNSYNILLKLNIDASIKLKFSFENSKIINSQFDIRNVALKIT